MSLEGKLKDFGIADILQLLAQQQKTGILLVERQTESAEIYFLNGLVIETRSSQHTDRLGEMLIRGGYVTRQQVTTALDRQGDTFDYLGKLLVRDGLIQHEVLQQALKTQMLETFFDILQWRDGQYRFITDKFKKEGALDTIPGIQSILLDVLRMIDEWPAIVKAIPSFEMVFTLADGHTPDDIEIDELPVYQLIDGRRSVQEIVDGSLMGRYAACKLLAELLQDGIIRHAGRKETSRQSRRLSLAAIVFGPGAYVLLAALLVLATILPTGFPATALPLLFSSSDQTRFVDSCVEQMHMRRITFGLEAFYLKNNHYPLALSELADNGFVPACMLPESIRYSADGLHYRLDTALRP